jgi:16S rRNA (adenine1518-N6/adenine1519-N6)-dimethyltransferase
LVRSAVRLGQHFLADSNLLEAIVRDAALDPTDVALEIGGGEGALTERLSPRVAHLHVVELDPALAERLRGLTASLPSTSVLAGDAMRVDLAALDPEPTAVVSNLPYSIATPVLLRTIAELPRIATWTVMVQREIADRLRASPGSRAYGAPSVLVQLACDVKLLRTVDRAVFTPRPRVDSALLRLVRRGAAAPPALATLVRGAFAHRRKPIAGSLELSEGPTRRRVRAALGAIGLDEGARAEALSPPDYVRLLARLEAE